MDASPRKSTTIGRANHEIKRELVTSNGYSANSVRGRVAAADNRHQRPVHVNDGRAAASLKLLVAWMLDGKLEDVEFAFAVQIAQAWPHDHVADKSGRPVELGLGLPGKCVDLRGARHVS